PSAAPSNLTSRSPQKHGGHGGSRRSPASSVNLRDLRVSVVKDVRLHPEARRYSRMTFAKWGMATSGSSISGCQTFSHSKLQSEIRGDSFPRQDNFHGSRPWITRARA